MIVDCKLTLNLEELDILGMALFKLNEKLMERDKSETTIDYEKSLDLQQKIQALKQLRLALNLEEDEEYSEFLASLEDEE